MENSENKSHSSRVFKLQVVAHLSAVHLSAVVFLFLMDSHGALPLKRGLSSSDTINQPSEKRSRTTLSPAELQHVNEKMRTVTRWIPYPAQASDEFWSEMCIGVFLPAFFKVLQDKGWLGSFIDMAKVALFPPDKRNEVIDHIRSAWMSGEWEILASYCEELFMAFVIFLIICYLFSFFPKATNSGLIECGSLVSGIRTTLIIAWFNSNA